MKKLTKRVQARGMWFDVPEYVNYVAFDADGEVYGYPSEPVVTRNKCYSSDFYEFIGVVDIEGADWRECCWYVGDQVDGDAAERREWMARGAEVVLSRLENWVVGADKYEGVCASINRGKQSLRDIRSGGVDL